MPTVWNEFRVGLFVLVATALVVVGYLWFWDGVARGEPSYTLDLAVPSADGLWKGSTVKLAGVEVGSVSTLEVQGSHAELDLEVRSQYELPVDTEAGVRASGMLGDRYIALYPGDADELLEDGDRIELRGEPADIDQIQRNAQQITEDVKVITEEVRRLVEDEENTEAVEQTLAHVEALSEELRYLAERNADDIDRIVGSVERLTAHLEEVTRETSRELDEEMARIEEATKTLQETLDHAESAAAKVDRGEGTLGALINDDETIDAINDTVAEVNEVVRGFSGLRAEVYYEGRLYAGTQPPDPPFYYGNPLHGSGANTLGVRLMPSEDFWWVFEVNDHPQGTIEVTETHVPSIGGAYREYTRRAAFRYSFMLEKRWYDVSLRLGIKESGGGLGATFYLFDDRVQLSLDAFDFEFGSYPALEASGIPNTRIGLRWEPIDHLHVEAGTEQLLLGLRYGYYTGYIGAGFHFYDDDIKLLLATLPLPN